MISNIAIAKISHPRSKGILPRPRLFKLLDSAMEYPVTWVSAPAGSGKTTLVASYLAERKLNALWYQVDEGDNDMATFFYYMGLAAKKATPRKKSSLPLLTPEYLQGIPAFTLRYFENLYSRLKPPFVVVFDNYQLVPENSPFHERISQGLDMVPEGISIFALSRLDPPAQFSRLRANDHLHLIDAGKIRFTLDESKTFVSARCPQEVPESLLVQLHEATGGWAAGLVLLTERGVEGNDGWDDLSVLPSNEIFNYFAYELFQKADSETQKVLLDTALFPTMTAYMAESLTGIPRAKDILSRLARDHFFTQRDEGSDSTYQYHPLFREFLLNEGRTRMSGAVMNSLQRRAARILQDSGKIVDAAHLFFMAGDWDGLTNLVVAHAADLISQGRNKSLEEILKMFSHDILEQNPWLLYWTGTSKLAYDVEKAEQLFKKAFDLFGARDDKLGEILACSGAINSINLAGNRFSYLAPWIEWLDRHMLAKPRTLTLEMEAGVACNMAWALYHRFPYRSDTKEWIEHALRLCRQAGDCNLELKALSVGTFYWWLTGDMERVLLLDRRAEEVLRSSGLSPSSVLMWKLADVSTKGTLKKGHKPAVDTVSAAIEMANTSGVHALDISFYWMGFAAALAMFDGAKATEYLALLERAAADQPGKKIPQYPCSAVVLYHLMGDLDRGVKIVRNMSGAAEWSVWQQMWVAHIQAEILFDHGDWDEAFQRLSILKDLVGRFEKPVYYTYVCQLDEAKFLLSSGQEDAGLDSLTKALAMGRELGYRSSNAWLYRLSLISLCRKALECDIEVAYVREMIRTQGLFPDSPPLDISEWPWPVRIRTLGTFEILVDDRPIEMTRLQKKPLSLLKALIALGGDGVREETLSELLWPDAEGDAAHVAFKTTLSRLRHLLGSDRAITFHEGRMSLDTRSVWVDTRTFTHLFNRMDDSNADPVTTADMVMDLYRGEFLPFEDEEWVISPREKWRDKFLRVIGTLGMRLEKDARWDEASACYRAALDVDDLAEQFYQRLMICHSQLGDLSAAASVYTRLCRVLKSRLGAEPSAKTSAIFRQIKS